MNIFRLSLSLIFLGLTTTSIGQIKPLEDIAIDYMKAKVMDEGYEATDFSDYKVISSYKTEHNGVTHIHIAQQYRGVEVENALFNINILPNGEVFHHGNSGVKSIASKAKQVNETVSCHAAFGTCLKDLGLSSSHLKTKYEERNEVRFTDIKGLNDDVLARKLYAKQSDGTYRLVWNMVLPPSEGQHSFRYQIDVATGQIIKKEETTISCHFGHADHDEHCDHQHHQTAHSHQSKSSFRSFSRPFNQLVDNAQYRVHPLNGESPNHINRSLVVDPADPAASPFGWHDTDGVSGAEFTITRGNNVHAALDLDGNDQSDGDEPDGGASLVFDFPLNLNNEPDQYQDASVVSLFYMSNVIHDILYHYGFDEASGNFQQTNYSGNGAGGDHIRAYAQASADEAPSPDTRNNANWSPTAEGFRPTMRNFVWERSRAGTDLIEVLAPSSLAGTTYRGTISSFGPGLNAVGVTGNVAVADSDGSSLACSAITNGNELNGNIAIIDRGVCNFDAKVQRAADVGAIAVIICNFEEQLIVPGGTVNSGIPSIMLSNLDCVELLANIENGLEIRMSLPAQTGPDEIDGTLDNGIVIHEYGHGISSRLVGGPQRAGCLSRDQQMGEGWSDFFTLALTHEAGDNANTPRGIGTFAIRENTDGKGIRRFPYTTDMAVNPHTYADIILTGSSPHALGTVWCTMLWDLYWAFTDRDGYDPDLYEGDGGNNTAIRLVVDGMKLLACSPTFLEARDAIIAADVANNGGVNEELIWTVFARRGLGHSATEGDVNDRTTVTEAFDLPPEVIKELKIIKTATELINPDEEVTVELFIRNDKSTSVTNVVVNDILPATASFVANSASQTVQLNGDQLTFNIGTIAAGQTHTITYRMTTSASHSDFIWFNGMEERLSEWTEDVVEGKEGWNVVNANAFNGQSAYFIKNDTVITDRALRVAQSIDLSGRNFPVLRFYHSIDTERGFDPGIVQLSRDGGANWEDAGDRIYKNGYSGKIPFQPFAIANQSGYYGDSQGYIDSYVDLRDFIGDQLMFRFRYGSDDVFQANGWYVDEVAVFDMKTLQSEACVTSVEGDNACDDLPFFGTVIEYDLSLDVDDLNEAVQNVDLTLSPNPTREWLNIILTGESISGEVIYKVMNVSGQLVQSGRFDTFSSNSQYPIDVSELASGMYFVQMIIGKQQVTERFVKSE